MILPKIAVEPRPLGVGKHREKGWGLEVMGERLTLYSMLLYDIEHAS